LENVVQEYIRMGYLVYRLNEDLSVLILGNY